MNCEKVQARLSALWDHELPEEQVRQVREHLDACGACGAAWEALNRLHRALGSDPLPPIPMDLAGRIVLAGRRRLQEKETAPRRRLAFPVFRPALVFRAVALAALLALGYLMGASSPHGAAAVPPADALEVFDLLPSQTPAGVIVGVMEGPEARS
jgi:anti-sigma factor RsiW